MKFRIHTLVAGYITIDLRKVNAILLLLLLLYIIDILIYLLTAIGLTPGGSSRVHMYTQTIHRTIENKQYIEQHNNFGRVRAVPRLG